MTAADVEALRRGYESLNRGDLTAVSALLAPDLVWREGTFAPEAGTHHGRESFESFVASWLASFEDFLLEPEEIVEVGDTLVAVVRQRGRGKASGLEVSATAVHAWTVREGKAIRWESFATREEALERLGEASA